MGTGITLEVIIQCGNCGSKQLKKTLKGSKTYIIDETSKFGIFYEEFLEQIPEKYGKYWYCANCDEKVCTDEELRIIFE